MEKRVVQKINTCLLFLNRRQKIELPLPNLKRQQPIERSLDATNPPVEVSLVLPVGFVASSSGSPVGFVASTDIKLQMADLIAGNGASLSDLFSMQRRCELAKRMQNSVWDWNAMGIIL